MAAELPPVLAQLEVQRVVVQHFGESRSAGWVAGLVGSVFDAGEMGDVALGPLLVGADLAPEHIGVVDGDGPVSNLGAVVRLEVVLG